MTTYRVTIDLNSISYDIKTDTEDEAIEIARENFFNETHYDILKWANWGVEELKDDHSN